jgi:D-methionine transport system substrate-binding protein
VNLLAVREADRDQPWVKALVESYRSPEVKAFIEKTFGSTVLPSW